MNMDREHRDRSISLQQLFVLLRRYVALILVSGLVCGLITWCVCSYLVAPVYEASAKMIVNSRQEQTGNMTNDQITSAQKLVDTYAIIIRSQPVMAPVIEKALASCLQAYNKQVINCCDTDLDTLCRTYIDNRIPVILWATIDMQVATAGNSWFLDNGELYVWPAGEHCLLLIGYDEHRYYFNDPRYGDIVAYAKTDVEHAYAALGQQALIIQ